MPRLNVSTGGGAVSPGFPRSLLPAWAPCSTLPEGRTGGARSLGLPRFAGHLLRSMAGLYRLLEMSCPSARDSWPRVRSSRNRPACTLSPYGRCPRGRPSTGGLSAETCLTGDASLPSDSSPDSCASRKERAPRPSKWLHRELQNAPAASQVIALSALNGCAVFVPRTACR